MSEKMKQPPFNMIGNIYYVGTKFVSSHLFTSSEGHILIDTCMPGDGVLILNNIKKLGFDICDIRYIFITHAHIDHIGSAAYIAKETGARICIGNEDVAIAEHRQIMRYDKFGNRTKNDLTNDVLSNKKEYFMDFEAVKVDEILKDKDCYELGTTKIEVHHTPGHTAGASSFSFQVEYKGKEFNGFLPGGIGVNVFQYELMKDNIFGASIDRYIDQLEQIKAMNVDVWLGAHPFFNETFEKKKRASHQHENINPYIDAEGGKNYIRKWLTEAKEILEEREVNF